MKNLLFKIIIIIPVCFTLAIQDYSQERENTRSLDILLQNRGTVGFTLHTDRTYKNGSQEVSFSQTLLELPGLASCILQRDYSGVFLTFQWNRSGTHA